MDNTHVKRLYALVAVLSPLLSMTLSAKCGGVDYSWGSDALAMMHDYVITMMLYVLYIAYAIAGIVVIVAAYRICQDEYRRRRHCQADHDGGRSLHLLDFGCHCTARHVRI